MKKLFAKAAITSMIASMAFIGTSCDDPDPNNDLLLGALLLSSQESAGSVTTVQITGKYVNTDWWNIDNDSNCAADTADKIAEPSDGDGTSFGPLKLNFTGAIVDDNATKTAYVKKTDGDTVCSLVGKFDFGFRATGTVDGATITGTLKRDADDGDDTTEYDVTEGTMTLTLTKGTDGEYTASVSNVSSAGAKASTSTTSLGLLTAASITDLEVSVTTQSVSEWSEYDITSNQTMSGVVLITDIVHVQDGATLTVTKGSTILGASGSAIIVHKGGRIVAEGTATSPIVFTSAKEVGKRSPGDWGGIVIIGKGISSRQSEKGIEGDATGQIKYGGAPYVAGFDSGTLKYVRIEFAGNEVAPGDELNVLSLYVVESGTTLDHIQLHRGYDDALEVWGGTVSGKYILATGSQDDDIDLDEGYSGQLQYVASLKYPANLHTASADPHAYENDGEKKSSDVYVSTPDIVNFTAVGYSVYTDSASATAAGNSKGIRSREGFKGRYVKGVVYGFGDDAFECKSSDGYVDPAARYIDMYFGDTGAADNATGCTEDNVNVDAIAALPITSEYKVKTKQFNMAPSSAAPDCSATGAVSTRISDETAHAGQTLSYEKKVSFFDDNTFCGAVENAANNWTGESWVEMSHN